MPVGYGGLFIALALWVWGTTFAYKRIRAKLLSQHNPAEGPLPAVRPILWTMWVSIGLAALGFLIVLVL